MVVPLRKGLINGKEMPNTERQDQEKPKHIKVYTKAGVVDMPDVDEYSCGYKFLHVRMLAEKKSVAIKRSVISKVEREVNGQWIPINLKKKVIK